MPREILLPGQRLNLQDPDVVIELFERAALVNLESPLRNGSTVRLPAEGHLTMTGDLHDNGLNFARLIKMAALHTEPTRHLILHEIIHGRHRVNGRDMSIRTLARVAALKLQYPDQVHLLQSNHELAQLGGQGISKGGVSVVREFDEAMDYLYGDDAEDVRDAMGQFIRSFILSVKCKNGVFCSHSLPSPHQLDAFDPTVIYRLPTDADLRSGGSGYVMVWGRNHTQELADHLASSWSASLFVMGHQPVEMGFETEGESMLILASDHEHGMALPIDLGKQYTMDELVAHLVPLASVIV